MTSLTDTFIRAELVSFARDPGDVDTPQPVAWHITPTACSG